MKIYDGGRAPNPRRVQIFLAEKGLEIPTVQMDLNALDHHSEEYAAKNPMKLVPALELDDGTCIGETVAICRYIEGLHPEPNMMGTDPKDAAIIEMWQRRVEQYYLMNVAGSFRHLHPGAAVLEGEQIAAFGEKSKVRAREFMEMLDKDMSGRDFIAGDRFTIADITAIVSYQFMKPARIAPPDDLENLTAWYARVSSRPSVQIKKD